MRKQLERQARRLQQSKLKPGVNTSTLVDAIHQTLTDLRCMNRIKDPMDLLGREIYALLVNDLDIDVPTLLSKVDPDRKPGMSRSSTAAPSSHHHHHHGLSSPSTEGTDRSLGGRRGGNSFSIENLLNSGVGGGVGSTARRSAQDRGQHVSRVKDRVPRSQHVTQPLGFMVNPDYSCSGSDYRDSDSDDDRSHSDLSSRASSPELDVTDDPDDQKPIPVLK